MASLANPYFPKGVASEQNLIQGLISESIQILGHTVYYIPRKLQRLDHLFGEDLLSQFVSALPIEMYIENYDKWLGEEELISKFGLEIRKQFILSISRARWETEVVNIASDMWVTARPQEGDLVYEPITKMLLEIKFVEQDSPLYQLSKRYQYKLTCEMFQYNRGETIATGIDEIDKGILSQLSNYQLLTQASEMIELEQGGYLNFDDNDNRADLFGNENDLTSEGVTIDWNVDNPFGDN